jgi:hypothetical protein
MNSEPANAGILRSPSPRPSPPGRGRNFVVLSETWLIPDSIQRARFSSNLFLEKR